VARPKPEKFEAIRERFRAEGQGHVFEFWPALAPADRAALLAQAQRIAPELPELIRAHHRALEALQSPGIDDIQPTDAVTLPEFGGDCTQIGEAERLGQELLRDGRLAVFVVAGGQGTRLGFPGPKGAFPLGPISDRSLFEIQAQKIRGLARRCGCRVPWYVMTSDATDAATRRFFVEHRNFGLPEADVRIFSQDMVPAFDFEGRLLLEMPGRIFESPGGHGGALTALSSSGALADMEDRGIDRIFYYQVDNPLVRIGDPVYLGFHERVGAEMSCKVVRKRDPMEKVGVVVRRNGRPGVVEYTELDAEHSHARDAAGQLMYWAGNIAIHILNRDFVARVAKHADRVLPYHASPKPIPTVDASGRALTPRQPNGYKLERFVFDALSEASEVCVVEVRAAEEFSPIKNAEGKDSPVSARADLSAVYRSWLERAKIDLPATAGRIEIDHSKIDGPEEAADAGFRSLAEAGDVIRVATGMES